MGILRLYLAVCVVAAHSNAVVPWRIYDGREAVQIFYVISGFYMQLILSSGRYERIRDFYSSRALRIFVPYYIVLALVIVVSVAMGLIFGEWLTLEATVRPQENGAAGTRIAVLTNFTLFFQDWVMFLQHDPGESLKFTPAFWSSKYWLGNYVWIPQGWSIGLELAFYLVAPFLARQASTRTLLFIVALSLAARFGCYVAIQGAYDPWTYRFFPFEIVHFIYGMIGCRLMLRFPKTFDRVTDGFEHGMTSPRWLRLLVLAALLLAVFAVHGQTLRDLRAAASHAVRGGGDLVYLAAMTGWIVVVPVLFAITRNFEMDRFIGELSYPVYLLHYTIIGLCGFWLGAMSFDRAHLGRVATIASIGAAILMQQWMLQPFENWRHKAFAKPAAK